MIRLFISYLFCFFAVISKGQSYFPPNSTADWDTISPSNLDWCNNKIDSLFTFLDNSNSKSFILLKDGKIVLEQYFNGHTDTSYWYWASSGKTLVSFLVGIAQNEGFLEITDTTSNYLGYGWTNCSTVEEEKITIWHQLTMTSGLDDGVVDPFCTNDTCLQFLSEAGTRWAYHNGPYTLLRPVLENATGQGINLYNFQKVLTPTGMDGFFSYDGFNNVFSSTSRSMARFGLLIQNNGVWDGNVILSDSTYFNEMVNTSQSFNESYGYLWWLNGKASFMLPQTQFVFDSSLFPNAPNDLITALGKNGQIINVVPSENMVWIRMGESAGDALVDASFNVEIWNYINELPCSSSSIYNLEKDNDKTLIKVVDLFGREIKQPKNTPVFYIYDDGTVEKKISIE